ncbi:MAG: phage capsid protein [Chitinophagales bacterium]|nr:MAG: phage capsid protein [Chitinophagales bacterium]
MTTREIRDEMGRILALQEDIIRNAQNEGRKDLTQEEEERFKRLDEDYRSLEKQLKRLEELEERAKAMATSVKERPGGGAIVDERALHEQAFKVFLRHGLKGLTPEMRQVLEKRDQTPATGAGGGYLIPEGFVAQVERVMKYYGPLFDDSVVTVFNTQAGNTLPWPTLDDTANKGQRIGPNTAVSTLDLTFGQKVFNAFKYTSGVVLVPTELFEDTGVELEPIIIEAFGERLGRIVNEELTKGAGGGTEPQGIVTASTQGKLAASNAAIAIEELADLIHSVDRAYRSGPKVGFMLHDSTVLQLKKLAIGSADSRPLWMPSTREGEPATIYGYPYWVNNDIDQIGASKKSVLFGDFSKYKVRVVRDRRIVRLTERYMDKDQVGYIAFWRLDGLLLVDNAVKHLAHPA